MIIAKVIASIIGAIIAIWLVLGIVGFVLGALPYFIVGGVLVTGGLVAREVHMMKNLPPGEANTPIIDATTKRLGNGR